MEGFGTPRVGLAARVRGARSRYGLGGTVPHRLAFSRGRLGAGGGEAQQSLPMQAIKSRGVWGTEPAVVQSLGRLTWERRGGGEGTSQLPGSCWEGAGGRMETGAGAGICAGTGIAPRCGRPRWSGRDWRTHVAAPGELGRARGAGTSDRGA